MHAWIFNVHRFSPYILSLYAPVYVQWKVYEWFYVCVCLQLASHHRQMWLQLGRCTSLTNKSKTGRQITEELSSLAFWVKMLRCLIFPYLPHNPFKRCLAYLFSGSSGINSICKRWLLLQFRKTAFGQSALLIKVVGKRDFKITVIINSGSLAVFKTSLDDLAEVSI